MKIFSRRVVLIGVALLIIALGIKIFIVFDYKKAVEPVAQSVHSAQSVTTPTPEVETTQPVVQEQPKVENSFADSKAVVTIAGKSIGVDLAVTPEQQAQGLSGRTGLKKDHGMLFDFEKVGWHGFWMKDMLFSIDMIWISEDKHIIHIEKNVSPETYPKTFGPNQSSKYVLEVTAGFSDQYGFAVGDQVEIIGNT